MHNMYTTKYLDYFNKIQTNPHDKKGIISYPVLLLSLPGYLSQVVPGSGTDDEHVAATVYQACMASNTAENEDQGE